GDAGEGGRDASVRLGRPRIARWGGGAAIAASVAFLAVFASRQRPVPGQSPATGERTSLVAELAAPTAPEPAPPVARQPAGAAGHSGQRRGPGPSPRTAARTSLVAGPAAPAATGPAPPVARQPAGAAGRELADAAAHAPGEVAGAGSEAALALAASAAALAD